MQSPTPVERAEIWEKLNAMQGSRCAYCEVMIAPGERHIEHFRQRNRYSQGTFDWSNLFGSCERKGTCGDHKDKCGSYDHTLLIKPDTEDPDEFLVFDAHGGVNPKARLSERDHARAEVTIRILNLTGEKTGLRYQRQAAVQGYLQFLDVWASLAAELPEDEWWPLVEEDLNAQLQATAHLPFVTTIRHVLSRIAP